MGIDNILQINGIASPGLGILQDSIMEKESFEGSGQEI